MYIASVSSTIKFHEFPSGSVVHNYQPGKVEGPIRSISWSRDGNWLVVVPYSGQTEIVSTKDQLKLLKTIHEVDEPMSACFQNTTKKNVGIGTKSGLILIYDIKSRSVKKRFPRASTQITHLTFTSKDTHCVAGCKNGDVLVYNNVTNSPPANLRVPRSNSINCLKANNLKRNLVLGGSNEGVIVVWDININRSKFCVEAHKAPVNSLAFSPVNSDLVVTAGADRQFCFYDIVDSKCIATISVENSITAVDFSPDGTYFVMASQNGRVYVYDSRNIQEPIHSFVAHKSAIRHIAFQNLQESGRSSVCSISTESVALNSVSSVEDVCKRRISSARTSDFFGVYTPTIEISNVAKSVASMDGGDSFLAALGLETAETSIMEEDVFLNNKENSRLPSIHDAEPPLPSVNKSNKSEIGDCKPKPFSSTPKLNFLSRPDASPSPMIVNGASGNEIKSLIKECFGEELKSIVHELKNDIKYQATHTTHQLRAMLLDMQMAMVKEFIKLENFNNKMREEAGSSAGHDSLLEENEMLKKQVKFLEEQMKNLTVDKEESE